jgi:hypothetical protein
VSCVAANPRAARSATGHSRRFDVRVVSVHPSISDMMLQRRERRSGQGGDICIAANCDLLDHIVGAGECRHRGGTCARPAISSTSCPRAIGVAGSEFVLDLGLRGSAQLGPRWFTKTLLVESRQSYLSTQTVAHATAASTDQRMRLFALRSAP